MSGEVYQSKIPKYAGHTAGPWEPHVEGEYPGINHNVGSVIIFGYKDEECGIRGKDRQQRLSNAVLIADAPYLACEVERLRDVAVNLQNAIDLYREASFQSHSGHWDSTGQHGRGCPECIRANDLRSKADSIINGIAKGGNE